MSLADCVKRGAFLNSDIAAMNSAAVEYMREGMPRSEAELTAAKEMLARYEQEKADIDYQIAQQYEIEQEKVAKRTPKKQTVQESAPIVENEPTPVVEKEPAPATKPALTSDEEAKIDAMAEKLSAPTLKEAVEEKAIPKTPAPTIKEARVPKPVKDAKTIKAARNDIEDSKKALRNAVARVSALDRAGKYSEAQAEKAADFIESAREVLNDPLIDGAELAALNKQFEEIGDPTAAKKELSRADGNMLADEEAGMPPPRARESTAGMETHTVESVTQHLNDTYGKNNVDSAIKRGSLVIARTGQDLPQSVRQGYYKEMGFDGDVGTWYPKTAQALYDQGTVYIIAENTVVAETDSVLIHDIGTHAGMYEVFNPAYQKILSELQAVQERLKKQEPVTPLEKLVSAAQERIPDTTSAEAKPHELMAYFVEEGAKAQTKLPLWKRMVSTLKEWLMKHGFVFRTDTETGIDAIVNLARGAAQSWVESSAPNPPGKGTTTLASEPAKAKAQKPLPTGPAEGSVRLAEHMHEIELIGRDKSFSKEAQAVRLASQHEVYLFNEIGRSLSNLLRKSPSISNALDFSKTVWERLAVPVNETLNKNYFGRLLKVIAQKHDALANNSKSNYSRFLEDILPVSLSGFLKSSDINKDTSSASIAMRIISDDMIGVISHNEALRKQFAEMVSNIATKTEKDSNVDVETRFDKLEKSKEVDAIVDLFWTTALARQPDIEKGKLRATYWRQNAEGVGVKAETDIHEFAYTPKAMEVAKKSHKLLVIAALERAISQHQQSNLYAKQNVDELADKMFLRKPSDARKALQSLNDIFSGVYEKDTAAAAQFLATIQKHMQMQEQGKDTTYDATPKQKTEMEELQDESEPVSPEAKARAAEVFKLYTDNKALIDSISRDLSAKQRSIVKERIGAVLNNVAANRAETTSYLGKTVDTVSHFYIAHQRSSPNRVYSRLVDDKGDPVNVSFDQYPSFVMGFDSFPEAKDFVEWYSNNKEAQEMRIKVVDRGGNEREAKMVLEAVRNDYEQLAKSPAPYFDLFTFTTQLERSGVNLSGSQREQLVKAVANRTAKQLKALKYRAGKGADVDIWKAYGAYLNGNAYIVANNYTQVQFDDILYKSSWGPQEVQKLLDNTKLMEPSAEKDAYVEELKEGLELTKRNAEYVNNIQDLSKKVFAEYRAEAGRAPNVFDDTMHFAATSFLMGNISTAITQILSLPILTISYLGAKHTKTSFGGGFGFTEVGKELTRSMASMAKMRLFLNTGNATQPFDRVLQDKLSKAKLSPRDKLLWDYVLREVKEGKLQIGQVMAVTDMYWRGFTPTRRQKNKYVEMFMKPFSMSEAYIRIASWTTAFNLGYNALSADARAELEASGNKAYDSPIFKKIAKDADETVEHSQGIYSQWARAPWLQNGWGRALTMFMHYPLVQVQLLKSMPLAGRAMYIALLVALAGVDGLPFKEDIDNLINAITRKFPEVFGRSGTKAFSGNIADWYKENLDGVMSFAGEGQGDLLQKGMLNAITGADFSGKLGFHGFARGLDSGTGSDIFPLLGPVGGFLDAAMTSTGNLANAVMALGSERDPMVYLERTAKTLPVSFIRNAANGAFMAMDGEARTRTGETVATELDNFDSFMQFLGWRPTEAAKQYSLGDRQQVYKDIRNNIIRRYNNQLALAKADGDMELFQAIRRESEELSDMYAEAGVPIKIKIDMDSVNEIAKGMRETLSRRRANKLPEDMQRYFEPEIQELEEGE